MAVYYHTDQFPPDVSTFDLAQLVPLLGPANAALARYDALLASLPNPRVLLSPLTTQEAVLSSRIEGTQATMGEVLEYEAEGAPEPGREDYKRQDIQEVHNYRQAVAEAEKLLQQLPLSQRVLLQSHAVLLNGVRGRNKKPGEYRTIQNWLGPHGCTVDQARFVPIGPLDLGAGMNRWEHYLHEDSAMDPLIQLAIVHAEFESLHPFIDGNGRLGRMLIPLFLADKKLLSSPNFYMSAYLEANRQAYYDHLLGISRDGDWTAWCVFFLEGLRDQALANAQRAQAILDLYEAYKHQIQALTHSQYCILALDFLFERPIFKGNSFTNEAGIPLATAKRILRQLRDNTDWLVELRPARGASPAAYGVRQVLAKAEGYDPFEEHM